MKTKITNLTWSYFKPKKHDRVGIAIAALGLTYFIVQVILSIVQKW